MEDRKKKAINYRYAARNLSYVIRNLNDVRDWLVVEHDTDGVEASDKAKQHLCDVMAHVVMTAGLLDPSQFDGHVPVGTEVADAPIE